MGIWNCLTCWNFIPERTSESYNTDDDLPTNVAQGVLVEKLLIATVPFEVFATEDDFQYERTGVYHAKMQQRHPFKVQPTYSFFNTNPPPQSPTGSRHMKKTHSQEDDSSRETDDEAHYRRPVKSPSISRASHRSELDDDAASSKAQSINIGQVGSTSTATIPSPYAVNEEVYKDFIQKYGSIFTDNIKDPIPKDPDPLNRSNVIRNKSLNIPSVPRWKDNTDADQKRASIRKVTMNDDQSIDSGDNQRDYSEMEILNTESATETNSDETYTSVYEQGTQTLESGSYTLINKSNTIQDFRNVGIEQTGLEFTPITEEILPIASGTQETFPGGIKEMQVEGVTDNDNSEKKALRWKIIIRHRTPPTEPAQVMTENIRPPNYNANDNVSTDSSYQ